MDSTFAIVGAKGDKRQWFTNSIDRATNTARIDIYGDIGESWWDDSAVSARDLLDFLAENHAEEIELHVNSGGGSVFDAFAIMTALRNHPARVTAYIDGLAASAASYLVAAADEIVISSVAWMMIHQASGLVIGNSADMRQTAEELDRIDGAIANIYRKRAGNGHDFAADMVAETWYDAEQAVAVGLADRIEEAVAIAACVNVADSIKAGAPAAAQALFTSAIDSVPETDTAEAGCVAQEHGAGEQERAVVIGGSVYIEKSE